MLRKLTAGLALVGLALALLLRVADGDVLVYRLGDWPAPFGITLVADTLGAVMVVLFIGLAAAGYFGAQAWQARQPDYRRLPGPVDCDLRAGPCAQTAGQAIVSLAIGPPGIPLMQTLTLEVDTGGLAADGVVVEIRGLNMDMGLNRTVLALSEDGRWRGETILPVCSQRRMEWEAAVQIEADERLELPFRFSTVRP